MKVLPITIFLFLITGCTKLVDAIERNDTTEVLAVVEKMNKSLTHHDLEELLTCYAQELDWENSFGWSIRDKEKLGAYFGEWLFARYPKMNPKQLKLDVKADRLNSELAWAEVVQYIYTEQLDSIVRTYRQTHLLIQEDDRWKIQKTRMWAPTKYQNAPDEFITSRSIF